MTRNTLLIWLSLVLQSLTKLVTLYEPHTSNEAAQEEQKWTHPNPQTKISLVCFCICASDSIYINIASYRMEKFWQLYFLGKYSLSIFHVSVLMFSVALIEAHPCTWQNEVHVSLKTQEENSQIKNEQVSWQSKNVKTYFFHSCISS